MYDDDTITTLYAPVTGYAYTRLSVGSARADSKERDREVMCHRVRSRPFHNIRFTPGVISTVLNSL